MVEARWFLKAGWEEDSKNQTSSRKAALCVGGACRRHQMERKLREGGRVVAREYFAGVTTSFLVN